eukprot:scaffold26758_cov64-Phaeocystis_antarctica.AAC.3
MQPYSSCLLLAPRSKLASNISHPRVGANAELAEPAKQPVAVLERLGWPRPSRLPAPMHHWRAQHMVFPVHLVNQTAEGWGCENLLYHRSLYDWRVNVELHDHKVADAGNRAEQRQGVGGRMRRSIDGVVEWLTYLCVVIVDRFPGKAPVEQYAARAVLAQEVLEASRLGGSREAVEERRSQVKEYAQGASACTRRWNLLLPQRDKVLRVEHRRVPSVAVVVRVAQERNLPRFGRRRVNARSLRPYMWAAGAAHQRLNRHASRDGRAAVREEEVRECLVVPHCGRTPPASVRDGYPLHNRGHDALVFHPLARALRQWSLVR